MTDADLSPMTPNTPAVDIRRLTLDDYLAIMATWQASGLHIRPQGRESYDRFAEQMALGVQTILGAYLDGKLVGVVLTTHDGRKGWINRLGVDQAYQRQGIGRQLVDAAEATLRAQGLKVICVLIEQHNVASLALFQAEGFKLEPIYYLTKRESSDA